MSPEIPIAYRLLIVEDDPVDTAIIREFLHDTPYQLEFAGNGEAAWVLLDAEPERFDAIILDRVMPGLGGIDLLARLVKDGRFFTLPAIMQTAATTPEQVAEGLAAGAWYYLAKPYSANALCQVIHGALNDRQHRLELHRLEQELDDTWQLLREGQFEFRTPQQARVLSARLGAFCPENPQLAMGLSELMLNAVEHGNLGIGYATKGALIAEDRLGEEIDRRLGTAEQQERWARLDFRRDREAIHVRIQDCGAGFDWQRYLEFEPERMFDAHGRGIAMARQMTFSRLEYQGKGNCVEASAPIVRS
ncbi:MULTISPECIES: response regulator [Thiorhodovibrio]|uniref:response regulator n=1 Tax=Thiorhodovibrio TaxID=61593 RepID=UPI001913CA5F|nr:MULTISPECIES: response regulator [Thiorhodovibrio]MBK5969159.1 response regulator receiver protein [Thiorhodovibrio winogradskyi]WPL13369.1 Chemotaxis protein CheY [Thiorhodovibrio litoralis]